MEFYHRPVLLEECLEGLALRPQGIYLDGTLGGGGHSAAILERLGPQGRLYGIDRDPQALQAAAARIQDRRFTPIRGNFHHAKQLLAQHGVADLDGALLDLGVSSHQLDARERGFSYHDDAPLDMRMDPDQPFSARDLVNQWSQEDIARVLRDYGEEKWAAQIARVLCDRRQSHPIQTTAQLVDIVDAAIPKKVRARDGSHPARRTFQALRIAVNDELAPLEQALRDLAELLVPGGRLCVIAFHSLEDRVVKNTFRSLADPCTCPKNLPVCVCGKTPTVRLITRKPITATPQELAENPRARSATLRVLEKLEAGHAHP
ncbi:MAG TPA: 16S rRNA (cytosine(1402)-N(4))-methyltransferase RsmH [Candidatus Excrementavichristensenella intestinipullorum]|nr:16S rRNA (cytosine(1402)-N(4))-methyltransferase RsmH [Candidatus Excrementavichristensenella intestinipullorum]